MNSLRMLLRIIFFPLNILFVIVVVGSSIIYNLVILMIIVGCFLYNDQDAIQDHIYYMKKRSVDYLEIIKNAIYIK